MTFATRRWIVMAVAGSLAAVAGVLGTGSLVFGGNDPANDPTPPAADREPAPGSRTLSATAITKRGKLGVLVYRNRAGERCMAVGEPDGTSVGVRAGGTFREAPLRETARCRLRLDPAAYSIQQTRDLPSTSENEAELVVWGVAASDVRAVVIRHAGKPTTVTPAPDGAFIAALGSDTSGSLRLSFDRGGRTDAVDEVPLADLERINEGLMRNAPRPGESPQTHAP